jgi:hypothetical protein
VEAGYLAAKAFRHAWNALAGFVPALQTSAVVRITYAEMTTATEIRYRIPVSFKSPDDLSAIAINK